ncbi:MAG: rod shape-determining protein MreD [Oscillospiraceae bacterium]|nr:rod shape-determining protein MreD [Oscillospiraceae bacterium]MDD4413913.1 rod shape-determining protein MreD [Oscillospiraceae bacterium]
MVIRMKYRGKMGAGHFISSLSSRYIKWTAYGIVILLTSILQSLPNFLPPIGGARPALMVPVVVCIAMFEGPVGGAAAGVAGGILWDLFSDRLLGFNALLLLIICCACGLMSQLLIRNNLISSMLMTAAALFIQGLISWFFYDFMFENQQALTALLSLSIPGFFYSLFLTPPIYFVVYSVAKILRNRE